MKINHKPLDKVMKAWGESIEKPNFSRIYNVEDLFEDIPTILTRFYSKFPMRSLRKQDGKKEMR